MSATKAVRLPQVVQQRSEGWLYCLQCRATTEHKVMNDTKSNLPVELNRVAVCPSMMCLGAEPKGSCGYMQDIQDNWPTQHDATKRGCSDTLPSRMGTCKALHSWQTQHDAGKGCTVTHSSKLGRACSLAVGYRCCSLLLRVGWPIPTTLKNQDTQEVGDLLTVALPRVAP